MNGGVVKGDSRALVRAPRKKPRPCSRRTENIAHSRYSGQNSKCAAGNRAPLCPFGRGKRVKTVRLNHLGGALLAAAAAGLLAAVGLMVVLLYAQPTEANFPGKPAKIAFSGYDGNDSEIYTIKLDGGGKVNVTDNGTSDYDPAYSPSGKKIAYVYDATGTDAEIYTIKVGGGGRQPVTDNGTNDNDPYWGSQ